MNADNAEEAQAPVNSVFGAFETDEQLEREGIDFYLGVGVGTWRIAYLGDQKFQAALAERMKPISHAQAQGLLDPKIAENILCDLYSEFIVKSFKDVIGRDGVEIPYSKDACAKLLRDLPHLFRLIRNLATNFANYRKVYAEETAKK